MKLAMISQPMKGKTQEEIREVRTRAEYYLLGKGYAVGRTCLPGDAECNSHALFYISESLRAMSECDAVYFCKGWKEARGCRIEHIAAEEYGLKIIEEGDEEE